MLNETYLIRKPIPTNIRYEVLSDGSEIIDTKTNCGVRMQLSLNKNREFRYKKIGLIVNGFVIQFYVHFLVAKTFIGTRPKGYEINHKDGNRYNNAFDNLEYVTRKENNIHARQLGLHKKGIDKPNAILTEDDVKVIFFSPERGKILAAKYNVSYKHISNIKRGRVWKWLTSTLRKEE